MIISVLRLSAATPGAGQADHGQRADCVVAISPDGRMPCVSPLAG
jgi:hypothetical protein